MAKTLVEIASEIVQAQVSLNPMSSAEIANSLQQVFAALREIQKSENTGAAFEVNPPPDEEKIEEKTLPGRPEDSIQNDKVICLECGLEMRQLTRKHLVLHNLTSKEYRKKYGISMSTPLAAKSLTRARSKAAKKRGLPENLQKFIEAKRQAKAEQSSSAKDKDKS